MAFVEKSGESVAKRGRKLFLALKQPSPSSFPPFLSKSCLEDLAMDPSTGHSSESLFLSEKRAYEASGKVVVSILERPLVAGGLQKPKEFVRDA